MSKTLKIWSFFSAIHLGLAALSTVLGIDRLSAIIAGSIYLPLWPITKLGVPVFQHNVGIFPLPNAFGWAFVVAFWAVLYWGVAAFIAFILQKRSRAD